MSKFVRRPPDGPDNVVYVAGGEVDEYHICLRLFGDDLDPKAISSTLGAEPTSSCRKGDIFRGKVSERVEKRGKWILRLPEKPGETFESQINGLLETLTADLSVWRELSSKYDVDLFCGVWLRSWNRGMTLSRETVAALADRNLTIGLDIYADLEENDA